MRSAEQGPARPPESPASQSALPPHPGNATRWRWGVGITLAYIVATIVMTWPLAARLGDSTPGGEDPLLQVWIARWVQHALVTDPRHLYDANIFYPYENTLAYSDSNVPGGAPRRADLPADRQRHRSRITCSSSAPSSSPPAGLYLLAGS